MQLVILALLGALLWIPSPGWGGQPGAEELQKQAQRAFIEGRYLDAEAANLELAREKSAREGRRYAVQMLGTLYENNLVDLRKAVHWHRTFMEEYADPGQIPFYREKIALLERLIPHQEAYRSYQAIQQAEAGDEEKVERLEALMSKYPDFILKPRIAKELAYAYARLDRRGDSYRSFQTLAQIGGDEYTESDRMAYEKSRRHWVRLTLWAGVAWGIVLILSAAAVLMNPWRRLDRGWVRLFLTCVLLWLLFSAARIPAYNAIRGEENLFHGAAIYIAAGMNLAVLFWALLLTRGRFWESRQRSRLWVCPLLTVAMTTAVFYLFLIHQPNGAEIMDAFGDKYLHWAESWRNRAPAE